jgi:hypothetical protein
MWFFLILVGLGIAFMLYALVQFHRELRGPRPRRQWSAAKQEIESYKRVIHQCDTVYPGRFREDGYQRMDSW